MDPIPVDYRIVGSKDFVFQNAAAVLDDLV